MDPNGTRSGPSQAQPVEEDFNGNDVRSDLNSGEDCCEKCRALKKRNQELKEQLHETRKRLSIRSQPPVRMEETEQYKRMRASTMEDATPPTNSYSERRRKKDS